MNKASLRLFLDWLEKNDLTELLPLQPAAPVMGRKNKRVNIHETVMYNNDRNTYNAYIDSIKRIFFYELPDLHSYSNNDGMHVSPEANVILKLIIANNFDVTIDYKDVCEFANV